MNRISARRRLPAKDYGTIIPCSTFGIHRANMGQPDCVLRKQCRPKRQWRQVGTEAPLTFEPQGFGMYSPDPLMALTSKKGNKHRPFFLVPIELPLEGPIVTLCAKSTTFNGMKKKHH